jgi:hypothetical protein
MYNGNYKESYCACHVLKAVIVNNVNGAVIRVRVAN